MVVETVALRVAQDNPGVALTVRDHASAPNRNQVQL